MSGLPVPEDSANALHRATVYLHPGQVIATLKPLAVSTILGSCVAVCLWSEQDGQGGMNHYLLPHGGGGSTSPRFGNVAMRTLIESVLALGCVKDDLRAKVFGGASVLESLRGSGGRLGAQNVGVARAVLAAEGIPLVAQDVGGSRGRRLVFHTDAGVAWVRLI